VTALEFATQPMKSGTASRDR